ncbi:MAG TPA: D-alanyl-D-alanine carboxypeptidase [Syntrophales bacterium]|nr:D-alanyl-D-alanine carboxypeptidase [Syntrophales bacterium]
MDPRGAILVIDGDGNILIERNGAPQYVPASTIKLLTALAAIHHWGLSHRFRTEFYVDAERNLIIKGYGDPFLVSEAWEEIAKSLSAKLRGFNHLILDNSYFAPGIVISGRGDSTNPYDAPPGALCANFNTVHADPDAEGRIADTEPQTPLSRAAGERCKTLGLKQGRYTFSHDERDITRYAGEVALYFMKREGIDMAGDISTGPVQAGDTLVYTHVSAFTLEAVIRGMMEFSNNFIANQLFLNLGADVYGPPATLEKGIRVIDRYLRDELGMTNVHIVEGSGLSRENCLSASEMDAILIQFEPYRHLLRKRAGVSFKTGRLEGIRTQVGYVETEAGVPCRFTVFQNKGRPEIDMIVRCIKTRCRRLPEDHPVRAEPAAIPSPSKSSPDR